MANGQPETEIAVFPLRRFPRVLAVLLAISLPLLNPWVRGDGVGYYAFARAPLIQHNLDFAPDYQHANQGFRETRLDSSGAPKEMFRTVTGHLENHFTVGPAILWAPFLVLAHIGVLLARAFGATLPADGFSLPYLLAMAFGTLFYGFLALVLSYHVACRFVAARWALLATVAVWWASSLPVYMYFNPAWSHAHSAFAVALFFWYWLRTRESRGLWQWIILALIAALMLNIYYANAVVLALLVPEALSDYNAAISRAKENAPRISALARYHIIFCSVIFAGLLPTFLSKYAVYGGFFKTGYISVTNWAWRSPWLLSLLFSTNHGLFSWTPLLLIAAIGIFLFCWQVPSLRVSILAVILGFYYFIAAYPDWAGISSYGNRFFVGFTVFFVLGLAVVIEAIAARFSRPSTAFACAAAVLAVFIIWNLGLIFQWGAHLIPARGPVSVRLVVYNQFHIVPRQISSQLQSYLLRRNDTLHQIEQKDLEQLNHSFPSDPVPAPKP